MSATPPGYQPPPQGPGPVTAGTGRPPGRTAIRVGVVLMVLGIVGGIALVVLSLTSLFDQGPPQPLDGRAVVEGERGDDFVIYRVEDAETPVDCQVTGPGEESVPVVPPVGSATLTLGNTTYRAASTFSLAADGEYVVTCADVAGRLAVGPDIELFRNLGLVFAGIFGGGGLFFVGLVVLIVGIVRRSTVRKTQPWGQNPQWGPGPPGGQGPWGA